MKGIGLYIRRLSRSKHGLPRQAAKRAADHGVSHVAIMGGWQQPRKNGKVRVGAPNASKLSAYVEAFAAKDISVGLWFYPWMGHEQQMLDVLYRQTDSAGIAYWLNDAELGYKWKRKASPAKQAGTNMRGVQPEAIKGLAAKGTARWSKQHARELQAGLLQARDDGYIESVGFTSYGIAKWHPNFPWSEFCHGVDFVSPQLYTATADQITDGLAQWDAYASAVRTPSVGTFGAKSKDKMHDHLSSFVDTTWGIDGFIAWSWMQTDSQEWRVLARWADWLERGACAL